MLSKTLLNDIKFFYFSPHNHYEILGLKRTASKVQIKQKYYELAKKYHPDVNQQPQAKKIFQEISNAYQILSNQNKKTQYDSHNPQQNSHKSKKNHQKTSFEEENPQSFSDFNQFFKKNKSYKKPKRGTDININVTISLKEAIQGITKTIKFSRQSICSNCYQQEHEMCFSCGGKGTFYNRSKRQKQQCQKCSGRGYKNLCSDCGGKGRISSTIDQNLYIEKNTHNKTILRVQGHGNQGYKSRNGDLYATIIVEDSDKFRIDGNNIYSYHQLDFLTAVFGGKAKVETLYGWKQIMIEEGTQTGKQIRIQNEGLQSPYSRRKGDHILTIRIKIPEVLSARQRSLLGQLL